MRFNLFIIILLSGFLCKAEIIEIPEVIKKSFEEKFPNARNAKWDSSAEKQFEVGFELNGKENVAVFLMDGTFKEIETEIKISEIPIRIKKSISKKFPLSKITYAIKVHRANDKIVYDLEVNTGIELLDITLDIMGFEVD